MDSSNINNFTIEEASIKSIQDALVKGDITCKELVLMYLNRIADYDKSGLMLNSVIEINPDAMHIAEVLDYELHTLGLRGPLYGIPILIKDNIDTYDKMHTSAGSVVLSNHYAKEDAFIVKKLREAGAIILGKTNMTEFANFMSYNMENGYSSRGGQVLNPYGPGRFDTGGSSSGSGVSVSANFCACAIGTETSGSILSPSCQNSIVGIKPTIGLISRTGILPIAHSQDTAGPMARTVEDAATVLGALVGTDLKDIITFKSRGRVYDDYSQFLDKDGLRGAKIGVPTDYYLDELSEEKKALFYEAVEIMEQKGAIIVKNTSIKTAGEFNDFDVLLYEFKSDLNAYLSNHSTGAISTLKDIIEFNDNNAEKCLKYSQEILRDSDKTSGTLTEEKYIKARIRDLSLSQKEGIDYVMERYELDALLFPGAYGADITARAGYPSIIVPAGYDNKGEPFGITFAAREFSEPTLLKIAYSFEQASKMRIPPKF